ncbi:MAG: disulfide oxidoreductase [Planctomycetota bacterium]
MPHFRPDMLVSDAMAIHPRAKEVFAGFHLGGCSSCSISYNESIEQVCMGYGVEVEMLLDALESLMTTHPVATPAPAPGAPADPQA